MDSPRYVVDQAPDDGAFVRTDETVWFNEVGTEPLATKILALGWGRFAALDARDTHADADAPTYAGVYGVRPMTLSIPGVGSEVRRLPTAGLTWVGVHPDHRRRGVLRAMMRHHLEQVREMPGVHLSALHASEPAIYGRFGYGLAALGGLGGAGPGHDPDARTSTPGRRAAHRAGDGQRRRTAPVRSTAGTRGRRSVGMITGDDEFYVRICSEPRRAARQGADAGAVRPARGRGRRAWPRSVASTSGSRPDQAATSTVSPSSASPTSRLALRRRLLDFDLIGIGQGVGPGPGRPPCCTGWPGRAAWPTPPSTTAPGCAWSISGGP